MLYAYLFPSHDRGGGYSDSGGAQNFLGGTGGPGIVVLRYQIGASETGTRKATGGFVSFAGGKTIHAFTSTQPFQITSGPLTCEFFIVAGGGGGGFDASGGGGAGGVVHHPGLAVANGTYLVTVGGGGAGGFRQPQRGSAGGDSSIAFPTTYLATGGGGGGSRSQADGGAGS